MTKQSWDADEFVREVFEETERVTPKGKPRDKSKAKKGGGQKHNPNWLDACIKGETHRPLAILANALIGLRAQWPGHFTYDEMLCSPILAQSLDEKDKQNFASHPVTDVDVGELQEQLQHAGLKRIARASDRAD